MTVSPALPGLLLCFAATTLLVLVCSLVPLLFPSHKLYPPFFLDMCIITDMGKRFFPRRHIGREIRSFWRFRFHRIGGGLRVQIPIQV